MGSNVKTVQILCTHVKSETYICLTGYLKQFLVKALAFPDQTRGRIGRCAKLLHSEENEVAIDRNRIIFFMRSLLSLSTLFQCALLPSVSAAPLKCMWFIIMMVTMMILCPPKVSLQGIVT